MIANPNQALWEKGDFTRIAASMRESGEALVVTQDAPRSPGIYGPAPEFTRPGVYDLTITVESPQARDVIRE